MTPMDHALECARNAALRGEIPVGAVVTDATGHIIATAGNRTEEQKNPTAHAEILVMTEAARIRENKFLSDCTLTVTLEPCAMCAGAIAAFRIKKLVFGAYDVKSGGVEHGPKIFSHATTHHKPEIIGGVRDSDCSDLLEKFFAGLRHASP